MNERRLYEILRPETAERRARWFRAVHHAMVAAGIAVILADTVGRWRAAYGGLFAGAFRLLSTFFVAEFLLRLAAAPGAPGASDCPPWRARLDWALSFGGALDFLGALPGILSFVLDTKDAILFGLVWVLKLPRYAPGLAGLRRAVANAHRALFSVLLGFGVVLVAASSLEYLLERRAQPDAFGSIPAALWWGDRDDDKQRLGDAVPQTLPGRALAGVVMICGIVVLALMAGILATAFAQEIRRHAFLRTWDVVAKVPFFTMIGAATIAEVARLLRPRDFPVGATIVRRGELGDCMYFIAAGEVEIELSPEPRRLEAGEFFGEIALLTGAARTATVVATRACTLLRLDIADFRELMGRQPDLARAIYDAVRQRLDAVGSEPTREREAAWEFGISA